MIEHDFDKSLEFLRLLYPNGPWMLTAISVDKKSIDARTFYQDDVGDIIPWLNLHKQKNLYYSVNQSIKEAGEKKKLSKTDISSVHYLHVDVDPRTGVDIHEEQKRIHDSIRSYKMEPTLVVFSGGGYNALWRLSRPFTVADQSSSEEETISRAIDLERRNWQFELDFDTPDHCRDISRILRLPGTINRPDAKKVAKGRVPVLAELVLNSGKSYDLSEFMATAVVAANKSTTSPVKRDIQRIETLDHLKIPDNLKVIIAQGFDPTNDKGAPSRSEVLFYVCCELVRCGIPDEVILGIITDSRFLISSSVLDKKAGSERYALRQLGRAKDMAIDPQFAAMNDRYAVIANHGGRCMIMIDDGKKEIEFQRKRDFIDAVDNKKLKFTDHGGKEKIIGIGTWWFGHPRRRQYDKVVFEPGLDTDGDFNLWRGFSVDPHSGDHHNRYLEHMFENICSGNQEYYDYLLSWMSRVIQTPRTQSMVAPVLLGHRGTGKSIFAKFFGSLFGRHSYVASDIHELTGRFNSHLSGVLFVLAEEAFDLRDKRHESVLKERITGQTFGIERKGHDIIQVKNYIHLMMTSNNERVVPAGDKERRFFVIRVKEKTHDDKWFLKILDDQKNGGLGNLLYHLLSMDLSNYSVTKIPDTITLKEQQQHNISYECDWLLQKLEVGHWLKGQKGAIVKTELHQDYLNYCREINVPRPMSLRTFGLWLKRELQGISDKQLTPRQDNSIPRPWAFLFPPMEACREQFVKNRGWNSHDWPPIISEDAIVIDINTGDPF